MSHTQQTQAADIVLQPRIGKHVLRLKREDGDFGFPKRKALNRILGLRFLQTARKIGKMALLPVPFGIFLQHVIIPLI
jgi:hypothetical protein